MTNIDYLIPMLRMELWDIDPTNYRYTDEWLSISLISSVKSLQRWWRNRYVVDVTNTIVTRGADATFVQGEPPVIDAADEMPIILMAAFLVKEGSLENSAWNTATWRDAEYYVSNVEGGKLRDAGLKRTWDRLLMYLKPPQKRLNAGAREEFNFGSSETL